ncbi:MAG: hypothetical protein C5B55_03235 [Blastocatellia bacterium]|nr:MAG: hypothetical protein C5B55_03235 [Blastocatellia bacterium]
MTTRSVIFIAASFLLALAVSSTPLSKTANGELTAPDLIAKHLESIGKAGARQAVKTRIISGTSLVVFRTVPTGQAAGLCVLASDGPKNLIGMSFRSPVYPQEEFAFNGSSFIAAFVTPGVRSSLGSFLMMQGVIFQQGLMGGALSSAWPLLSIQDKNVKVEYAGTKKVNGQVLHELKYIPKAGTELQISLFFDEATARHVRTEYRRLIPAVTGDRSYGNVQERESRYKLVEEFSEFKEEAGLTLPHQYKIEFSADTHAGTFLAEWTLVLNKFVFNEPIDQNSFNISAPKD